MRKPKSIEGTLAIAGMGLWRIERFVLRAGTYVELYLGGSWILGSLRFCGGPICQFVVAEDEVQVSLRPGLRVHALNLKHD